MGMQEKKEGRRIMIKTRKAAATRVARKDRPATAKMLRDALRHTIEPGTLAYACEVAGVDLRTATADEIFEFSYGLRWAVAWKRPLSEYYEAFVAR